MRQYRSAVRMGALNLLVLIIALCLVVLSVLALVSANSMSSFTGKQEASATEYYTQEIAGQSFLASLDSAWSDFAEDGEHEISQTTIDGILDAALVRATVMSAGIEITGSAELIKPAEMYQQMGIPYAARGRLGDKGVQESLEAEDPDYAKAIAGALDTCDGAVRLHLSMESGRELHALIGLVRGGGGTIVLKWESGREWVEKEEELWVPDGSFAGEQGPMALDESADGEGIDEARELVLLDGGAMGAEMGVASENQR